MNNLRLMSLSYLRWRFTCHAAVTSLHMTCRWVMNEGSKGVFVIHALVVLIFMSIT